MAAIAVKQYKTTSLDGEDGTTTLALDAAVTAGSTLVVTGTVVEYPASTSILLSSVNDTSSNTWGTPTNVRTTSASLPNVFACVAENVAAGSPTVTLNWDSASGVRVAFALIEVSGSVTSSGVDKNVNGTSTNALTVSTAATGALTQAANLVILTAGGWFGTATNPSGWTNVLNRANGSPHVGSLVCYKTTAATDSVTGTVVYNATASAAALMLVIKEAAAGAALRYKFLLNPATFTSADTGVVGYVWRNGTPDEVLAEAYTDLEGSATDGTLYIAAADGMPGDVQITDTIVGAFYNAGGDGSRPFAAGVVEEV